MLERIGLEYDGEISAVTAFGIFVRLDEIYVEGLVHVTALNNDYYHYDQISQHLTGERTGQILRMGDKVRIKVVEVNLDERKIDFECISHEMSGPKSKNTINKVKPRRTRGKSSAKKIDKNASTKNPKTKKVFAKPIKAKNKKTQKTKKATNKRSKTRRTKR